MKNIDFDITEMLQEYADENGYQLGGWHPDKDGMIVGHFHWLTNGCTGTLKTKFVTFDRSGEPLTSNEEKTEAA